MLSDIDLCSRALIKLGAEPISSFDDGNAEADVAAELYGHVRDAVISAHPWTFAQAQMTMAKLAATPVADYQYAYQLPSDFLRALSVGIDGKGSGVSYRIAEKRLHTDEDGIVLTYIFRPDETAWPPYFDHVLITRLTAEFCIPITESTTRAEKLDRLAEIQFVRAKTTDSQQQTPGSINKFPLIDCRE